MSTSLPPGISFRLMRVADIPEVHAIDRMSFSLPWPERSFRFEVAKNECARPWVAAAPVEGTSKIIAMLVLWLILEEVQVATIAVHPDFRRRGIASHLLWKALEAARIEGARRAMLEVRAGNTAAQEMYRKFGFEVVGRRPQYYKDNNEDAFLMTLDRLTADVGRRIDER